MLFVVICFAHFKTVIEFVFSFLIIGDKVPIVGALGQEHQGGEVDEQGCHGLGGEAESLLQFGGGQVRTVFGDSLGEGQCKER